MGSPSRSLGLVLLKYWSTYQVHLTKWDCFVSRWMQVNEVELSWGWILLRLAWFNWDHMSLSYLAVNNFNDYNNFYVAAAPHFVQSFYKKSEMFRVLELQNMHFINLPLLNILLPRLLHHMLSTSGPHPWFFLCLLSLLSIFYCFVFVPILEPCSDFHDYFGYIYLFWLYILLVDTVPILKWKISDFLYKDPSFNGFSSLAFLL